MVTSFPSGVPDAVICNHETIIVALAVQGQCNGAGFPALIIAGESAGESIFQCVCYNLAHDQSTGDSSLDGHRDISHINPAPDIGPGPIRLEQYRVRFSV